MKNVIRLNVQKWLRYTLSTVTLSLCAGMYARPVDPEEALTLAENFLESSSSQHGVFKSPGQTQVPVSVAYTAQKDGVDCFYVVNTADGFIIVSADTRLNTILGYSDEGQFEIDKISPDMKWWLDCYRDEISSALPLLSESAGAISPVKKAQRQPIAPLVTTKWNQDAPYNNNCPIDPGTGRRSVTGCVATAMAQIMKYHNWPEKPTGSNGGLVFTGTTLDWPNMLDEYVSGKYTATEATAVATLMRQCGAAVDMSYSYWGSGAYDNRAQAALRTYFGYSADLKMEWRDYCMQKEWNNMIYTELAAGRPVYYSGSSSYGGHAFVCDGYSANEYFHFNWGWGGYQDGYFLLTALNPDTGGAGSYEGGYNSHQAIITGIRPAAGQVAKQVAILSSGSFYYKNATYIVEDSLYPETSLFYNPLYDTVSVYFGLKIVDANDPSAVPQYVRCGSKVSLRPSYGTTEFAGPLPALKDGTYHVYGVFSSDGNTWSDIQIPIGKQEYVTVTVKSGNKTFSNDGPDKSLAPHLIMGAPQSTSVIPASGEKIFRIPFINTGKGDFIGEIGISLFGEGEFGNVISINNDVSVPGESSTIIEFTTDQQVAPGDYTLYVYDSNDNLLSEGYILKIDADKMPSPDKTVLEASNMFPQYYTVGDKRMMLVTLENNSKKSLTTKLGFVFVDPTTLKTVGTVWSSEFDVASDYNERVSVGPISLPLTAGEYLWYVVDKDNKMISQPSTMIVESPVKTSNGIAYIVTNESRKEARIVANEGAPYTGSLNIPAAIDGYRITAISQSAFAFCTLRDLTLPANISYLEDGGFYNANYLEYLHLNSNQIIDIQPDTFSDKADDYLWIDQKAGLANQYAVADIWSRFRYPHWTLEPGAGTSFVDIEINPETGKAYDPYCVGFNQPMTMRVSGPEGMNVLYFTIIGKEWIGEIINPRVSMVNVPSLGCHYGKITLKATTDQVKVETIESDDFVSDNVYSIDGRILKRDASRDELLSLPAGIYIWRGEKIIVTK